MTGLDPQSHKKTLDSQKIAVQARNDKSLFLTFETASFCFNLRTALCYQKERKTLRSSSLFVSNKTVFETDLIL